MHLAVAEIALREKAKKNGFVFHHNEWNGDLTLSRAGKVFVSGMYERVRDWLDGYIEGKNS